MAFLGWSRPRARFYIQNPRMPSDHESIEAPTLSSPSSAQVDSTDAQRETNASSQRVQFSAPNSPTISSPPEQSSRRNSTINLHLPNLNIVDPIRKSIDGLFTSLHITSPSTSHPRKSLNDVRKSIEVQRFSVDYPVHLREYVGEWILDRSLSTDDNDLLKLQGVGLIARTTARRLNFYNLHTLEFREGMWMLRAHVTADIPFVDFVYENWLDGCERDCKWPCGYSAFLE